MRDAAAGAHPVHRAGLDRDLSAEAVAVHDLAVIEEGHGGEPDMGMRAHVEPRAGAELGGPEMVEEDERADHAAVRMRQRAADVEAAEIDAARHDDEVDRVARRRVAGDRVLAGKKAHSIPRS